MFFKKINNADLWEKIQKLRTILKSENDFKERICWRCSKELNIYDFLSDNLDYSAQDIIELWQNPYLEFHCCTCFKDLKIKLLEDIERDLRIRLCSNCNFPIDIYKFSKIFCKAGIYLRLILPA